MNKECCGTCLYHFLESDDEWVCDNDYSDAYGLETAYDDSCEDYEGMDES